MQTLPSARPGRAPLRPDDGRLVRGRRSRARILAAARILFHEQGFDGATLRAIAARAGMGASSIYRHVRSKEELLIEDLAARQEEAWRHFRLEDDRRLPVRARLRSFFEHQHRLLSEDPDLTNIALRALTHREAGVARRVLALHDRTIGLLAELLQSARLQGSVGPQADLVEGARALFHAALGARIAWANGLLGADDCLASIHSSMELILRGFEATR